jgi:predicted metal-dependent TIM-barrel fold hydrolase
MTVWSDMLDNIYTSEIGVDATLTPGSGSEALTVRIIDKTRGMEFVNDSNTGVMSISPAATIRMSTLEAEGLTRADLDDGVVTINSKDWRIKSHVLKPNPDGELKGEVVMILSDEAL